MIFEVVHQLTLLCSTITKCVRGSRYGRRRWDIVLLGLDYGNVVMIVKLIWCDDIVMDNVYFVLVAFRLVTESLALVLCSLDLRRLL